MINFTETLKNLKVKPHEIASIGRVLQSALEAADPFLVI
jgi:hypothetical protein